MQLSPRQSISDISKIGGLVALITFLIAAIFEERNDFFWFFSSMTIVFILLLIPIGIVKGFDFYMHDAPPNAPVRYYYFLALGLSSAITALFFSDAMYTITMKAKSFLLF